MLMEKIEYLRKNGRTRGKKKGVMFCGLHPSDYLSVIVGFSLCNVMDDFDVVRGEKKPGFGLQMAKDRALAWSDHTDFFIQNSWTEEELENPEIPLIFVINPNKIKNDDGTAMFNELVVEVPPSIVYRLIIFLERCRRYYKDKDFPIWCNKLELAEDFDGTVYVEDVRSGVRFPSCENEELEPIFNSNQLEDVKAIELEQIEEME